MDKEIKNVLNGEYSNKQFDIYMEDLLIHSILTMDMSAYMCARNLRWQVICGELEKVYEDEQNEENILGL